MNNAKGIIQDEVYFITTTVVNWIDIFTRPKYKHIVLESLDYCRQHKGLIIYAWVLMSNHLHAIVRSESEESVADIMRDFKKHTSKRIIAELQDDMQESRREWMLSQFGFAAANDTKTSKYRFWQDGYHSRPCRRICSNDAIVPADFPCRRICTNKTNVPADLQSAGIEYKDFQSAYFLFMIYRYESRIADPYIRYSRIAYPPEQ